MGSSGSHRGALTVALLLVVPLALVAALVSSAALGAPARLWTLALVTPLLVIVPAWLGWRLARWRRRGQPLTARLSLLLGAMLIVQALVVLSLLLSGKATLRQTLDTGDGLLKLVRGRPSAVPPVRAGPVARAKSAQDAERRVVPHEPVSPPRAAKAARPAEAAPGASSQAAGSARPFAPSFGPGPRPTGWPRSKGLPWELDPAAAFRRARAERKPVLAYVSSHGCPHCRKMEQGTWSKPALQRALRAVIPLAVYRWNEASGGPSTMALRLGVMAYPQVRWLDPWGRSLPVQVNRNEQRLRASIDEARAAVARLSSPGPSSLPPALQASLTPVERDACASAEVLQRATCWSRLLRADKLDASALAALLGWETDAVTRQLVLDRLQAGAASVRGPAAQRVIDEALVARLADPNDYVRAAVLKMLARRGAVAQLPAIHRLLARLERPGRAIVANTNNLRAAVLEALALFADPSSVEPLEASAAQACRGGANSNCRRVCQAATALWSKHRDRGAGRVVLAMLRHLPRKKAPAPIQRLIERDTRCALELLGNVQGVAVAPAKGVTAEALYKAARAAIARFGH